MLETPTQDAALAGAYAAAHAERSAAFARVCAWLWALRVIPNVKRKETGPKDRSRHFDCPA